MQWQEPTTWSLAYDERCHICRRVPLVEDTTMCITTCVSCEETKAATMSNLLLNVRFGEWHLQVQRGFPWLPSIGHNSYHTKARKLDRDWKWFEVYR